MVDTSAHCLGLFDLIAKNTADIDVLFEFGGTNYRAAVGTIVNISLGFKFTAFLGTTYYATDGRLVAVFNAIVGKSDRSFVGASGNSTTFIVSDKTAKLAGSAKGRSRCPGNVLSRYLVLQKWPFIRNKPF